MITSEQAFLYAIQSFPKWMDIRKYPRTANGAKYLQSIIKEQDNVVTELKKYIKDCFLASYIGRENTIIDYAYIAQVGNIDINLIKIDKIKITNDPKLFLNNRETYCLFQDGYIIIDQALIAPEDNILYYTYNEQEYSSTLIKTHIWNIFDEFAMMSSLERYDNETNEELMKRCFLSFSNKPNSSIDGIKNTITNALINYVPLSNSDIKIETPNLDNMSKLINNTSLYEKLTKFNRDFFRVKIWDISVWEHKFKELDYIPNVWDTTLDFYQIGTGQGLDLSTKLLNSTDNDTTNIEVNGYTISEAIINEYIHKHNISKEIALKLKKYKNELKSKKIDYRIKAFNVFEIEPTSIYLKSSIKKSGENICYLEDIISPNDELTTINPGKLENGTYNLKFLPRDNFSSMNIYNVDIINKDNKKSLLTEDKVFKFKNGILQNIDVLAHINSLDKLKTYDNIIQKNGLTIGPYGTKGTMAIDITGMDGKPLNIKTNCKEVNFTNDTQFVNYTGFELDNNILTSKEDASSSNIIIDLYCSSLSFSFLKAEDPIMQGSCSVSISVDDKIDTMSGLWTTPKTYHKEFDKFCHVHVEIQKIGMYPISIKDIMASRYKITKYLDYGELLITPFNTMLPSYNGKENTLYIDIESYSSYAPTIEYIHIGPSLKYSYYEINNISITENDILKLSTDCRVELYKDNNLISNDYSTFNIYKNNTNKNILVEIFTDNFIDIVNSSKKILKTNYNGRTINYIEFLPSEEISYITINGTFLIDKDRKSIYELLSLSKDDKVYISSGSSGFIVKSIDKKEKICVINKDLLSYQSNVYSYELSNNNMIGCFVLDKNNNIISKTNQLDKNFEETYIVLNDNTEYIAYNTETIFSSEISNIDMVNTFYPLLDFNKMMFYKIDSMLYDNIDINFIKQYQDNIEYDKWSLGNKQLKINCDFDFTNMDIFNLDVDEINEIFTISSVIELDETYVINGQEEDIGKFIIEPPDDMIVNYEENTVQEELIIEDDGFNKLYYSNVNNIISIKINNITLSSSNYMLNKDSGIIVWLNKTYVGQKAIIIYDYNRPVSLSYKSLDSLYASVGYAVDAYKIINSQPIIINDSKNNDINIIDFGNNIIPDKIIAHCDNPNFGVIIEENKITTKIINQNNNIVVKTGYFYDNVGNEFYFFENMYSDPIDKMSYIELHHVKRTIDFLQFMQKSINHVLDSIMTNYNRTIELCHIDSEYKDVKGISKLNSISSCDTFESWINFEMDISLDKQFNDICLKFNPLKSNSYALLELNPNNNILSLLASKTLNLSICKEIKLRQNSMSKSILVEPYAKLSNVNDTNVYYYNFKNEDLSFRYFLLVMGNGYLDDILLLSQDKDIIASHNKNLNILFNDGIQEKAYELYEHIFNFDINGNTLNGLELNSDNEIQTGSNVDWGVTQIYNIKQDLDKCILEKVILNHGAFYSTDNDSEYGSIITPAIMLNNKKSIKDLYVVINNVVINEMSGFNIKLLTSNSIDNNFNKLFSVDKSNILEMTVANIFDYIKIKIELPPHKIINDLSIYATYFEGETTSPKINRNNEGFLITKVYDTTYEDKFILSKIDCNITNKEYFKFYIRGYKKDNMSEVFTQWYECIFDDKFNCTNAHIFENYRFFQFKIDINNANTVVKINNIYMKVVK